MELRMRKQIAVGSVLALGLASQVMAAEGFSYNNVEAAYVHSKLTLDGGEGSGSGKGDGFSISGSVAIGSNFFAFGGLGDTDIDGIKVKPLNLGVGFHWMLSDTMDFVSGASFERLKLSVDGSSASESGFGLSAGVRGRLGESFEWTGGLKYTDVGDYGDGIGFGAGGRYYFTPAFAVGVDYNHQKLKNSIVSIKTNTWTVALRYDFGS
jgi:opacity protein-like surface antigen